MPYISWEILHSALELRMLGHHGRFKFKFKFNQLLILIEKFSPLPGFEPWTSRYKSCKKLGKFTLDQFYLLDLLSKAKYTIFLQLNRFSSRYFQIFLNYSRKCLCSKKECIYIQHIKRNWKWEMEKKRKKDKKERKKEREREREKERKKKNKKKI